MIARDILPTARGSGRSEALYLPGPPQSHPRGMAPSMGFVLGPGRHLAGILLMTERDKTGFQGGSARDDDQGAQFQIGRHRSVRRHPIPSRRASGRISAGYRLGYRLGYRQDIGRDIGSRLDTYRYALPLHGDSRHAALTATNASDPTFLPRSGFNRPNISSVGAEKTPTLRGGAAAAPG